MNTRMPMREGWWTSQQLQSMHEGDITPSNAKRRKYRIRPEGIKNCCSRMLSTYRGYWLGMISTVTLDWKIPDCWIATLIWLECATGLN